MSSTETGSADLLPGLPARRRRPLLLQLTLLQAKKRRQPSASAGGARDSPMQGIDWTAERRAERRFYRTGPHTRAKPEVSRSAATATSRKRRRCAGQSDARHRLDCGTQSGSTFFLRKVPLSEQKNRRYAYAHLRNFQRWGG